MLERAGCCEARARLSRPPESTRFVKAGNTSTDWSRATLSWSAAAKGWAAASSAAEPATKGQDAEVPVKKGS